MIENELLYSLSNPEIKVSITKDKKVYIETTTFKGYLEQFDTTTLNNDGVLLLLFLNEISIFSGENIKMTYLSFITNGKSKPNKSSLKLADGGNNTTVSELGGTRHCGANYAVTAGVGRSATAASLAYDLAHTNFYNGCTKVGSIDTSCLFGGDHFCVSTQEYNCPCN